MYLRKGLCGACHAILENRYRAKLIFGSPEAKRALKRYREKRWPKKFIEMK
jgi:hypothetical protein